MILSTLLALHVDTPYRQIAIEEPTLSRAVELTQRYRLRGYDAAQVVTALVVMARSYRRISTGAVRASPSV